MKHLTEEEVSQQKKLYDEWLKTLHVGAEKTAFGIWLAAIKFNKNKEIYSIYDHGERSKQLERILEEHSKRISENL